MKKGLSVIAGIVILLFAYSASAAVVTNGLVSYWKFDGDATDSWTNNNDGSVSGSPVYTTTDTAGSASSGALIFDGTDDYVNCGKDTSLQLDLMSSYTIESWLKGPETTDETHLYSHYYLKDKGKIFEFYDGSAWKNMSHTDVRDGSWHHFAIVNSNGYYYAYIDGSLDTEKNIAAQLDNPGDREFVIGCYQLGLGYFFNGTIDDFRIYDRALSPEEITQNYNAIPEPSTLLFMGAGLLGLLGLRRFRK